MLSKSLDVWSEPLAHVPADDPIEDELHGAVIKLIDGDCVEVSQESWCNGVTPPTRWSHGCNQQDVDEIDLINGT